MVLYTVTAVWVLGHPNLDTVYILELVDQDKTRGTAVAVSFWPLVSLYIPTSFGVLVRRQFVKCPVLLCCFLRISCASFVRNAEGHIYW